MEIVNVIAFILVLIGAIIWGIIGVSGINVLDLITGESGSTAARIVYVIVGVAAIYLIIAAFVGGGNLAFVMR